MLLGNLSHSGTYNSLLRDGVWKVVLSWHNKNFNDRPIGTLPQNGLSYSVPIMEGEIKALLQSITTKDRIEKDFEAHRRMIDIQVCLGGSELIEWAPIGSLVAKTEYNEQKDVCMLHRPPQLGSTCSMTPGMMAIFFPEDAHMPGLRSKHDQVTKIVFKVPIALVI